MFNTWKYDPETDEVQVVHRAFDPITARSSQHQACDRCHNKKLKCSGDKSGCERCIAANERCEYTRTGSTSRRSKRGSSSRSEEHGSHSRSSRRHEGHSEPHRSSGGGSSSRSRRHEQESMLHTLDMSMLGPDDGFDLNSFSDPHAAALSGHSTHANHQQSQHYQHSGQSASYGTWHGYPASSGSMAGSYGVTSGQDYQDGYIDYQMQYGTDPRYWPQGR